MPVVSGPVGAGRERVPGQSTGHRGDPPRLLRVGLVCPYDLDVPGGVREQVLGLAGTLVAAGHEVAVLAPRGRGASAVDDLDGVLVHSAGPAVALRSNGSTARLAVGPLARARAAAWAGGGFDVVHVHEPIPPGIGHSVLRRLATEREDDRPGPAVVATVHVSMSPWPAGRSRSLRTASRHVGGALRGVDVLAAVSEHARRTLVDHLGRVPLVVPNGVDVDGWAAAEPRSDGRGPVVLVLGRADEPRKGVDVLLRAWPAVRAAVPDARLVVVGPSRRTRGGAPAGTAHGTAGVHLTGTVTEADKRSLVAGADVLVAPHRGGESFGIVLVEAMAAGTAVVASDLPAFRDVLAGTGVLVPPGDPAALAAAVVSSLRAASEGASPGAGPPGAGPPGAGPHAAGSLVAAARERAETYSWPVVGAAWLQVYDLALAVAAGPEEARTRLRQHLRERAVEARTLAERGAGTDGPTRGTTTDAGHGRGGGWQQLLQALAAAAADPDDGPAQSRLTAALRGHALPPEVRRRLVARTHGVRAVRALSNDLARRRGLAMVELDDDVGDAGGSPSTWP